MKISKHTLLAAGAAGVIGFFSSPAFATNTAVENSMKGNSNVSAFYQAMIDTGVVNELNSGGSYTVFAPTNAAMNEISRDKYPCFYSHACKEELADIVRNHIVSHEVGLEDSLHSAVFSIDKTHLAMNEPQKRNYTVEGHKIVKQHQLLGSALYEIDGVIANPQELANIAQPKVIAVTTGAALVPVAMVPVTTVVTPVEQRVVTKKTYYAPEGTPDGETKTTTVTTEAVVPVR